MVPSELRSRVMANAHESHQGLVRTKQRLRDRFWWPGMDSEVHEMLRDCAHCSTHEGHTKLCRPPLHPIPLPAGPWRKVMIDLIGPLPGPPQERYGIVLVDMYSRWPEVAFCGDVTAATVIAFLRSLFAREGAPEELVSDNGPQFRSAELADFLKTVGVRQVFSSPYSPQTCGMVERLNRTVKGAILSAGMMRQPRGPHVQAFLQTYRSTTHPATGVSPFRAMRGREMRTALDVLPLPAALDSQLEAQAHKYQQGYRVKYDARRAGAAPTWSVGDRVRVRGPRTGTVTGEPAVLIARKTGPVSYRLADGRRVHARRLAAAPVAESTTEADPSSWPAGVEGDESTEVASPQSTPRRLVQPPSPPERAQTPQSPVPAPRRSLRTPRPPVRFSPS